MMRDLSSIAILVTFSNLRDIAIEFDFSYNCATVDNISTDRPSRGYFAVAEPLFMSRIPIIRRVTWRLLDSENKVANMFLLNRTSKCCHLFLCVQ